MQVPQLGGCSPKLFIIQDSPQWGARPRNLPPLRVQARGPLVTSPICHLYRPTPTTSRIGYKKGATPQDPG